jgi:hypothetical protein
VFSLEIRVQNTGLNSKRFLDAMMPPSSEPSTPQDRSPHTSAQIASPQITLSPEILEATSVLSQAGSNAPGPAMEGDPVQGNDVSGGIIVIVSRCIKPGREAEFEERLQELRSLLEQQAGFCEMKAYQPSTAHDEHKVLMHFDSAEHLAR